MRCDVSWLRLEQYALGELSSPEHAAVQAHVGDCPKCQRFLSQIESDQRPMPELRPAPQRSQGWLAAVGGLALAAVVMLVVALDAPDPARPGPRRTVKGGELAVGLVREHGGHIQDNPSAYGSGDRFQARVTCPPGRHRLRLDVQQSGEPLQLLAEGPIRCGNQVPAGAPFVLTGQRPTVICATLDPDTAHAARVCRFLDPIDD